MKCSKCNKNGVDLSKAFLAGALCNGCFQKQVEKRVRKFARVNRIFQKNQKILILDDGSVNAAITACIMRKLLIYIPHTSTVRKTGFEKIKFKGKPYPQFDRIVVPWSLDKEIEMFLKGLFCDSTHIYSDKRIVKLLCNVTQEEISLLSNINNLKQRKTIPYDREICRMVDTLQKRNPEVRFCLLKSLQYCQKSI
ncbi:MAG: hypothetical protein ABIG95_03205 [Candidatus Woesearchaeota archaeon]